MSAAPDYIEPIVGWRAWLVVREDEGFRLRSIVYDAPWFPRHELVARCFQWRLSLPWFKRSEHVPPAGGCRCGIYAARDPKDVSLWGQVVECTRGWRGSRAYPRMIYVPATRAPLWLKAERAEEVALGLTDYDIPVELLDAGSARPEELVAALGTEATRG